MREIPSIPGIRRFVTTRSKGCCWKEAHAASSSGAACTIKSARSNWPRNSSRVTSRSSTSSTCLSRTGRAVVRRARRVPLSATVRLKITSHPHVRCRKDMGNTGKGREIAGNEPEGVHTPRSRTALLGQDRGIPTANHRPVQAGWTCTPGDCHYVGQLASESVVSKERVSKFHDILTRPSRAEEDRSDLGYFPCGRAQLRGCDLHWEESRSGLAVMLPVCSPLHPLVV